MDIQLLQAHYMVIKYYHLYLCKIGGINVYDLKAGSNIRLQLKGHDSNSVNHLDFLRLADDLKVKNFK